MKQKLREHANQPRAQTGASEAIQQRLMTQDWWAAAFSGGHLSLDGERAGDGGPDGRSVGAWRPGGGAGVPGRQLCWGWVDAATRWRKGAHGIWEPAQSPAARRQTCG
jgi:hypothetical protein